MTHPSKQGISLVDDERKHVKSVLCVIEDDPEMTDLVRVLLEDQQQMEIKGTCATAKEALELIRSVPTDLVILDHFIEGDIMGLQAAPMIKQAAPDAKIILLSGHDLSVESEREQAIDAFLAKSQVNELVPTCLRLLGL